MRGIAIASGFALAVSSAPNSRAQVPDSIAAAPGEAPIVTIHAEGAQIYECRADSGGKLAWQFREPIAALMINGKTVGRHFAGPNWELADGSAVTGKVAGRAPGASRLLKLVFERSGTPSLVEQNLAERIEARSARRQTAFQRPSRRPSIEFQQPASAKDIPLLKLKVDSQRGAGQLTGASSVQRINTRGGIAEGPCDQGSTYLSVPYSADYVFLRKGG